MNKLYDAKYIIKINRQEIEKEMGVSAENKKDAADCVRKYAQQEYGRYAFRIKIRAIKTK